MRLAIVNHHGGAPAGAEQTLLLFLERLPADIEPVIYLFEDGAFAELLRAQFRYVNIIPMDANLKATTRSSMNFSVVGASVSLVRRLSAAMRREQVDAVLTNSVKAHLIGSAAAKISGIPAINFMHDLLEGKTLTAVRLASKYMASARLACSQVVADNIGLPNTSVVFAPINLRDYADLPSQAQARAALGLPNDGKPIVGIVGRFVRWKGQDRFLRIAAKVLQRVDAHFAIIGGPIFACEPEYPAELERLVQELGIADRVHFTGWQNDPKIVYAALNVCCNCSIREPFGRSIAEALACGVPSVCFDDSGASELFGDSGGGAKVPAGDEDRFAEAVVSFIDGSLPGTQTRELALAIGQQLDTDALMPKFLLAVNPQRRAT